MILIDINNIEDVRDSAPSSKVTSTQLDADPVKGSICFAEVGDGILAHGRYSGNVRVSGPLSETAVTLGVLIGSGDAKVNGQTITPGGVVLFPAGFEHEAQYHGGLDYLLYSVDRKRLQHAANCRGLKLKNRAMGKISSFNTTKTHANRLRARAQQIVSNIRMNPVLHEHQVASEAMSEDLFDMFLGSSLGKNLAGTETRSHFAFQTTLVREVENWLRRDGSRSVSIRDISNRFGYSPRTLHRVFEAEIGISPAQYLKLYRLSQARRELCGNNGKLISVTKTAYNWGFWDTGRFSGMYRKYFGELPSETLKKSTESLSLHR
ncbi:MAG: AraC family transcriptional regulator [Paracoccaceae bacterium]